ncbi:MAG: hypothetical protein GF418_01215, partial [Chitinivibrionales bacterium]|nr:hypothetical protein [Chitinivibrionales bacterium]MBD3394221.1 hypothetical protein [Chitinivibrionales bacterium]
MRFNGLMFSTLVALAWLSSSVVVSAKTYIVSQTGKLSKRTALAKPQKAFRTIEDAVVHVTAGDKVMVESGNYGGFS